jgi:probable blue pigment (indigoidine) exporter
VSAHAIDLPDAAPSAPSALPGRVGITFATALAPASWGTTYLVTSELLPPGHPMFAALARALPAGLLALLLTRRLPHGGWWWKSMVLGALNIGVFFSLLFVSAERLPGGIAATVGSIQPTIVALLAWTVLHERLSRWRLGWGIVGVVGVGLVVLGPAAALDGVGLAAGLAGAVAMATGVTLSKKWGRPEDVGPTAYAGWLLTAGGLFLLPAVALFEGVPRDADATAAGGYVWLGLAGGLIAYTLWFRGIGRLPVTATALLGLLSPVVATTLGVVVLDESFTTAQIIGIGLTLVALLAGQAGSADMTDLRSAAGPRSALRGGSTCRWPPAPTHG